VIVELTNYELFLAANVGIRRFIKSKSWDKTHQHQKNFSWNDDIEAAAAEMAVAKLLNVYWDGSVNTFKIPDVGGIFQVRHTMQHNGCLIFRSVDSPLERYVFVRGAVAYHSPAGSYDVVGWIDGEEAKQDKFLRNPNGTGQAWFVPGEALRDMGELINGH